MFKLSSPRSSRPRSANAVSRWTTSRACHGHVLGFAQILVEVVELERNVDRLLRLSLIGSGDVGTISFQGHCVPPGVGPGDSGRRPGGRVAPASPSRSGRMSFPSMTRSAGTWLPASPAKVEAGRACSQTHGKRIPPELSFGQRTRQAGRAFPLPRSFLSRAKRRRLFAPWRIGSPLSDVKTTRVFSSIPNRARAFKSSIVARVDLFDRVAISARWPTSRRTSRWHTAANAACCVPGRGRTVECVVRFDEADRLIGSDGSTDAGRVRFRSPVHCGAGCAGV